ncbi:Uncharacterised protein [Streptococcus pneumoniae]|mgnify:CR=1 FL=1|jgi:hypothetical protein|uniref:Uncharacterized protein n=2 Tax=root TaxID=1 RepID=A0A916L6R4_STREE|nr:hypothetical protein phiARI0460-2_30 [Streptococcus phage phiARI0460-2]CEV48111.1 Uncharacterised protein [Streptococcus pneumoniae]CEV62462.1 Uncharacterised protein [Streptococcus pneumoniae]CEV79997.1 Uncharacterised protein [Streptococcus pneumoniae]CEW12757.1 Uncharacterised protein [Streptococcus pneumoniae]
MIPKFRAYDGGSLNRMYQLDEGSIYENPELLEVKE